MEATAVSENRSAQKKEVCALVGVAAGFRAFYEVTVDDGQLMNGAWISILLGMILALPTALSLAAIRRYRPEAETDSVVRELVGSGGLKALAATYLSVMVYDAGASLRIMASAAKYVAMPEENRALIMLTTAAAAGICVGLGARATAGGALLWRKLALILLATLAVTQLPYYRTGWLTPILGPGTKVLLDGAIPTAGMFCFPAAAWLLMSPEHDREGKAMLYTLLRSGLVCAASAVLFCMLVPSVLSGDQFRTVRLGRLLLNGRGGLSLEMPYVVLLYGGFLTMLLFELTVGAHVLRAFAPKLSQKWRTGIVSGAAFLIAVCGGAEQAAVARLSAWYYPLLAAPAAILGTIAWLRMRRMRTKGRRA